MQLDNTAAIVTGGASGLGAATAIALAGQGAKVFAFDLAASIENAAGVAGVEYVEADVTSPGDVRRGVEHAAGTGIPLRTVVNCAGIGPSMRILGKRGPHDLDLYAKVIAVNLVGSFNVLATASESIAATEPDEHGQRGVIINTASIAARGVSWSTWRGPFEGALPRIQPRSHCAHLRQSSTHAELNRLRLALWP